MKTKTADLRWQEESREALTESFGNDRSSGTAKSADRFQDLWRQLGECHQNALQGN